MRADDFKEWATGRSWWWRALVLAFLISQVMPTLKAQGAWTLFSGINFGAHEFGHLFWSFGGEWIGVAGGSLTQLLVPIGAAALMVRARDWFGLAACGLFLASSMADLSWYIGDARTEEMDLLSFSAEGAIHDWNYLLRSMGLLEQDRAIARLVRFLGWLLTATSTFFALRLFFWMGRVSPGAAAQSPP